MLVFEYDVKDILYFRIDRKRKLPVTTLLYALGYNKKEILETFYNFKTFDFDKKTQKWKTKFNPEDTIKISVCGVSSKIAERYFKKKGNTNIVFSHPKESEFIIMTNRTEYNFKTKKISNCFDIYEGKDILQVKRNGLLLSTIRKIN